MVAEAMKFLGWIVNLNGRRLDRLYAQYRSRVIPILHGSPMLTRKMPKRAERRRLAKALGVPFRPVYGYRA